MNRRGELGWNLETIGKLIIGVATLAVILVLGFKLVGLFVGDYEESAAYRNLHLLGNRIDAVYKQELSGPEASVVFEYPAEGSIISFTRTMTQFSQCEGTEMAALQIPRPKSCGKKSCICLVSTGQVLACHELDMDMLTFASYEAPQRARCLLTPNLAANEITLQSLELEKTPSGVVVRFDEATLPTATSGQALADQYGRGP